MRILLAGQVFTSWFGGQAVFTRHLAEGLARAGHDVLMLLPSDRIRAYQTARDGIQFRRITAVPLVPPYSDVDITPMPNAEVSSAMDEFRPDIVHVQDHYPLCRAALTAALERSLPRLGTNHFMPENLTAHMPVVPRSRRLRTRVDRLLWKMLADVYNQLDVAVAPTETGGRMMQDNGIHVPVHAVTCGVDINRFRPDPALDRAAVRARWGLDPARACLLYVGRVDPEKRLDVLVNAFHHLQRADAQLAIVGRGRAARSLRKQVRQLGLEDRVVFTGYVPLRDLNAVLNSADVFVMPSDAELQSIATLEAMAAGRPVLAANAGALPELVRDGVNGHLFDPGDVEAAAQAIERMLDERTSWASMSMASLDLVRPHRLDEMLRRYQELYRHLAMVPVAQPVPA